MLSSLPTELLREIITAAVPHTFHSTTYQDRQRTLCSISLVSKLFCSIAQPLLLEIVYVKSVRQLETLPPSIDEGGGGAYGNKVIVSAVISLKDNIDFLPENVGAGFRAVKNVEILTLDGNYQGRVDLSLIGSFKSMLAPTLAATSSTRAHSSLLQTDLSNLHLSNCKAVATEPVILPNLRSLTLYFVDEDLTLALLNPDSLPGLEELGWYEYSAKIANMIDRSSFNRLLPQLESLLFPLSVWKNLADAEVRSAASRTLVDVSIDDLSDLAKSTLQPLHLRARRLTQIHEHTRLATFFEETASLTSYIESNSSLPLRSVYLTCDNPSTVLFSTSTTSQGYVEDLSRVCRNRKIDLIFETGPSVRLIDPCISPEFSRRMKERKRRENVG